MKAGRMGSFAGAARPGRVALATLLLWLATGAAADADPLAFWNDRPARQAIVASVGRLDRGLDEAPTRGWTLVSMKRDWKRVFERP